MVHQPLTSDLSRDRTKTQLFRKYSISRGCTKDKSHHPPRSLQTAIILHIQFLLIMIDHSLLIVHYT